MSIEAKELRIGSWYKNKSLNKNLKYKQITSFEDASYVAIYCDPIQLTEEWLADFGFEYDDIDGNSGYWKLGNFEVVFGEDGCSYNWNLKIEFVHQLQNLVFALTGEELALKQTDNI
jgi:hypothetical protein